MIYVQMPSDKTVFVKKADKLSAENIVEIISDYYNISLDKMKSKKRYREIVVSRQMCMFFLKRNTLLTLNEIGKMFGNRDHTTVIHANKTINDLIETDNKIAWDVNVIDKRIHNH